MRNIFLLLLLTISAFAQSGSGDVRADLRVRASQMRSDFEHYWNGLDLPLERQEDAARESGDMAKVIALKSKRAIVLQQYEQLVQQRINDANVALSRYGIGRRYATHHAKVKAEDAADFAKFLEAIADGLR